VVVVIARLRVLATTNCVPCVDLFLRCHSNTDNTGPGCCRRLGVDRTQYYIDQKAETLYFFPPIPLESWTSGPVITQHLFAADVSGT
jgi:hypothetical protein